MHSEKEQGLEQVLGLHHDCVVSYSWNRPRQSPVVAIGLEVLFCPRLDEELRELVPARGSG